MQPGFLSASRAGAILARELGGTWELSAASGSTAAVRIARQRSRSVVVKLTTTPASILTRLAELQVSPSVLAVGDDHGDPYMVQQAVQGPHPDHAWFLAHRAEWAAMVGHYLNVLFNDTRHDHDGAAFHLGLFAQATEQRPWLSSAG